MGELLDAFSIAVLIVMAPYLLWKLSGALQGAVRILSKVRIPSCKSKDVSPKTILSGIIAQRLLTNYKKVEVGPRYGGHPSGLHLLKYEDDKLALKLEYLPYHNPRITFVSCKVNGEGVTLDIEPLEKVLKKVIALKEASDKHEKVYAEEMKALDSIEKLMGTPPLPSPESLDRTPTPYELLQPVRIKAG